MSEYPFFFAYLDDDDVVQSARDTTRLSHEQIDEFQRQVLLHIGRMRGQAVKWRSSSRGESG